MESHRKIESTPDLLFRYQDIVLEAAQKGVREALIKHKAAGNPIAASQDGKVVIIQPEDIVIP